MKIDSIVRSLAGCPCGRPHLAEVGAIEIGHGLVADAGRILRENGFPKNILLVADENTIAAAKGIRESLREAGFSVREKLYGNMRTADMHEVSEILELVKNSPDIDGILSVGTGSLNDICRYSSFLCQRDFAIFATAPSMDGFASGTAPITENGFKTTRQAHQPKVIIADTGILADAPARLKSAGFGDMIGKCVGLCDWRVSTLLTGEYYCENIANLTRKAFRRMMELAPHVTERDEETARAIMESLILTGVAMKLADSVRPASGTEHIISHFWEIKKLEMGLISDFHGLKVGVGTLLANRVYQKVAGLARVSAHPDSLDWDKLEEVYGPHFIGDVRRLNNPTVTDETTPARIEEAWPEICRAVREELPDDVTLTAAMKAAGAELDCAGIAVSRELGETGLRWHPYMRHRMTLMRILPMLDIDDPFAGIEV